MTSDGQITVTLAENNSETQSGGPEEAGAHQVLLGFAEARWGREIELLRTPINCCARIRAFPRAGCRAARSPRLPKSGHKAKAKLKASSFSSSSCECPGWACRRQGPGISLQGAQLSHTTPSKIRTPKDRFCKKSDATCFIPFSTRG